MAGRTGLLHAVVVEARPTQTAGAGGVARSHVAGEAVGGEYSGAGVAGVVASRTEHYANVHIAEHAVARSRDEFPQVSGSARKASSRSSLASGAGRIAGRARGIASAGVEVAVHTIAHTGRQVKRAEPARITGSASSPCVRSTIQAGVIASKASIVKIIKSCFAETLACGCI